MKPFSQKDSRWKDLLINGKYSLGEFGCVVVSIASILELPPDQVLKTLNTKECFTNSGLIIWDKAAKELGAIYGGKTMKKQKELCLLETNHFAKRGIPQHFCVWIGNGNIMDPLDGKIKSNPYFIVSFRLFKKKKVKIPKEIIVASKKQSENFFEKVFKWMYINTSKFLPWIK